MHEGTWTIRPCPHRVQTELAQELGISELTASILVRRGYANAADARAFLAGEQPPHDPFLLGDMHAACERIRAAIADGTRICVHGDYDVDGISATALAVLLLRELGAGGDPRACARRAPAARAGRAGRWAPAEPVRRRLRRVERHARAARRRG